MRDLSLGFAAGVMLAVSFFSLIIPALDAAELQSDNGATPAAIVCVAILLGMGGVRPRFASLLPDEDKCQSRSKIGQCTGVIFPSGRV